MKNTIVIVKKAKTSEEINAVRVLFQKYHKFLNADLCFQSFEEELNGLPGKYIHPDGDLLIGLIDKRIVGCVAVRKLDETTCEMKRLYVSSETRGTGLGKKMAEEIINVARNLGYETMRLDTLERLTEAMRLYEKLGFKKTDAYYRNPLPGVIYWELDLNQPTFSEKQ